MSVYTVCVQNLLELQLQAIANCLCGCWDPHSGPLRKPLMLLTSEPSISVSSVRHLIERNYELSHSMVARGEKGLRKAAGSDTSPARL